jgi:hypothetical protein
MGATWPRGWESLSPSVCRWRNRDREQGIAGSRRAVTVGRAGALRMQKSAVCASDYRPPKAATHWSARRLADEGGLVRQLRHRIWQKYGLQPHRMEHFKSFDQTRPLLLVAAGGATSHGAYSAAFAENRVAAVASGLGGPRKASRFRSRNERVGPRCRGIRPKTAVSAVLVPWRGRTGPAAPWETSLTATWALTLRLQTVWCQWESDSGSKMEIPAKFL